VFTRVRNELGHAMKRRRFETTRDKLPNDKKPYDISQEAPIGGDCKEKAARPLSLFLRVLTADR